MVNKDFLFKNIITDIYNRESGKLTKITYYVFPDWLYYFLGTIFSILTGHKNSHTMTFYNLL